MNYRVRFFTVLHRTLACAVLLAAGCARVPLVGRIIDSDTLPERVSDADIVIVGRLSSVSERSHVEEEMAFENGQYFTRYLYFDLGTIEVREVLEGSFGNEIIHVRFPSFDQTQPHPLARADCAQFSVHDIWQTGIWLLQRDPDREPRFRARRGGFVPFERLAEVKEILGGR